MSYFDVHYDDVAPKIGELEGAKNAKNSQISYPLNLLLFVLIIIMYIKRTHF